MGVELHPWQAHVGDVSLELKRQTGPVHGCGWRPAVWVWSLGAPVRQSGMGGRPCRTAVSGARAAQDSPVWWVPTGARAQRVAFTAQDRIGALGRWYEHVDMSWVAVREGVSRLVRKNGEEWLYSRGTEVVDVITPSRTGARGLALDLVVIDEALAHPAELLAAIRPTMAQRDGAGGCIGTAGACLECR